jgi:hypothetical protein
MIGFPGEFEGDVFETIKLNKKIRAIHDELTSCAMSYVAPYAGTVIHNICLDLGCIEGSSSLYSRSNQIIESGGLIVQTNQLDYSDKWKDLSGKILFNNFENF